MDFAEAGYQLPQLLVNGAPLGAVAKMSFAEAIHQLPQQLVNGVLLGAVYALIALGYTMVYGVLRFINFAHGDVLMVGAFLGLFTAQGLHAAGMPLTSFGTGAIVLVVVMLGSAVFGMFIEATAYRPLRKRPRLTVLITAIGVSLFLEYAVQLKYPTPLGFPSIIPNQQFHFIPTARDTTGAPSEFLISLSTNQIIALFVAVALLLLLRHIVVHTKMGMAMRALSNNPMACSLMGVNTNIIISFTFGLGSALAGAAAILTSINYPQIWPMMGILPGIKAFVAAVVGGIGNIPGAALGALIIGVLETLVVAYVSPSYKDAVAFALLIIILLVKPSGILGKSEIVKV